ncbi:hypothetical protein D917_03782, partial [Trichinella nativa]
MEEQAPGGLRKWEPSWRILGNPPMCRGGKPGGSRAVKIVPEEDVPEGNKEALEKREETSTSGVEKSQVSLPRCSGQRGLPNVVKQTRQQLAAMERGLKTWATEKHWRQ